MKQIIISEEENGSISLKANQGIKWTTFITGIEMLIEVMKENAIKEIDIDDILDDIRRIWERDKKVSYVKNKR